MKKSFTTTITVLAALASVATSIPAGAQSRNRDSDRDGRSDHAEWNKDRDRDGRMDQYDRDDRPRARNRDDRRGHHWRDKRGRNWQYYGNNYGYDGYRGEYRTGQRYPHYRDRNYYVSDYGSYGLPAPRQGYRYYRDRNTGDIIMAAVAGGVIGLIIGRSTR